MQNALIKNASLIAMGAALVAGCSPQAAPATAVVVDKVYAVAPSALKVKAGIVTGEMTELKVTERVEEGSGKVATPAKLTGKLVLKNVSADQSVRLLAGKLVYIDAQGKPIKMEEARTEPVIKIASQYGSSERLDPGQEASQSVDAEFPVAALEAKKLKDIRLELSFIPSPYKEETFNFPVSVSIGKK